MEALLSGTLKIFLFAITGFVGAYVSFFICRWWPTLYVDQRGIPKKEIEKINLKVALGASVATAALALVGVVFD